MKLKNLFYLLLALPLAFASCSDLLGGDDTQTEEPKAPTLTVTSSLEVEVEAEGGTQMITYTLVNAPADAKVSATCEAEWITDLTVASSIIYEVAANEGEAREATIVVSYEEQSFNVVVKQAAKPASTVLRFEVTAESTIEFDCNAFSGSIGYILENPIEGVEVVAVSNQDWVEVTAIADGAIDFTAQANEGRAREATITISYGPLDPVVITLKQAQYIDPSEVVNEFVITECWANCENGGAQWDVIFVEHDDTKGDMYTIISFALAEANSQRITDGTYTVENGGILLNPANENGFSTYRSNVSDLAANIYAASFQVVTNTANKTISIVGTFSAADVNLAINYNGEMRGMDLTEAVAGAIEHTEWTSVTKNWEENKELLFTAVSADGSLTAMFDFYDYDSSKVLAAGEYEVTEWYSGINTPHLRATSVFTYNGVESQLASGSATVEHIAGGYKITYNVVDKLGREFAGVIEGAISGATNPA
ncbi:MAG: BACON domain-containing protein [Alistipes sp.]|nr:BACON domain-containing protein [Alistipes sp.]